MQTEIKEAIARAAGSEPRRFSPLGGGCIADVTRVEMADGRTLVAKVGEAGSGLDLEGAMLEALARLSALPVPQVIHADDALLLMTYIESGGGLTAEAQVHGADLVAALHEVTAPTFGFEWDTVIGGLHQPNPFSEQWVPFFREERLMYMGRVGLDAGRLPAPLMTRLESFAGHLEEWLAEPARPSLIHGDMWTGNVLSAGGRVIGFVDPAIYYADAEIELAFSTLFGTFGDAFFGRYQEHRPLRPGFFEERRDIYNLYPLLVHVRLFGGAYVASVERTLSRFGF